MKKIGAEILICCLKEQGVDTVFGYPGGAVLDIYDAIYRDGGIRHIRTAHEQGAAHAADGYARSTGRTGVVIATSGPGATNLVTGIATAFMDSVPLVAITGNVGLPFLGRDSFQEIDITGITMPITKHNFIVKDVNDLAPTLRQAFEIANTGRKGPVLVDILKNVQIAEAEYVFTAPVRHAVRKISEEALRPLAEILRTAERPLLMAGGGTVSSGAEKALMALAEKLNAPVACTLMGLGAFPASHPLFVGMMGMHGSETAAKLALESDCILALGTRFSDRVALDRDHFSEGKTIVQIDIDDAEIDKNVRVAYSVLGDVREALEALLPLIPAVKNRPYAAQIPQLRTGERGRNGTPEFGKLILTAAASVAKDAVVVTDVGQHQMWTAQCYPFERPRQLCTSGGLGTMGFGLGAAIGAAIGTGKHVILVTGDGSFNMNLNELSTAVGAGLPVTILLMNNHALGMVRQWQKVFYGRRFSQTQMYAKTDYLRLAESFGAKGMRIEKEADIVPVLREAFSIPSVVLVECSIGEDDNVLPMIKPGQTYDKIIIDREEIE